MSAKRLRLLGVGGLACGLAAVGLFALAAPSGSVVLAVAGLVLAAGGAASSLIAIATARTNPSVLALVGLSLTGLVIAVGGMFLLGYAIGMRLG